MKQITLLSNALHVPICIFVTMEIAHRSVQQGAMEFLSAVMAAVNQMVVVVSCYFLHSATTTTCNILNPTQLHTILDYLHSGLFCQWNACTLTLCLSTICLAICLIQRRRRENDYTGY